jgi:hypothetical protein
MALHCVRRAHENASIESFNRWLRDELMKEALFR